MLVVTLTIRTANGYVDVDGQQLYDGDTKEYAIGTTATLTPEPNQDPVQYSFAQWSGNILAGHERDNPLLLDMDGNREIIAYFSEDDATYYVDLNSGSDELTSGGLGNPFATIGYALNFLQSGNSLKIYEGTYNESIIVDVDGISIECLGEVIIDGGGADQCMLIEANNIAIKGLKFTNGALAGLKIYKDMVTLNNVTTEKCEAYSNGIGFHILDSEDVVIRACVSHDNSSNGFDFGNCVNSLIENSVSYGNAGDGVVLYDVDGCIARYNITFNNDTGFYVSAGSGIGATLYNNIAYQNTDKGFEVANDAYDVIVINNIGHDNSGGDVLVDMPTPSRVDFNYWGDGNGIFVPSYDSNSLSEAADGPPGFFDPNDLRVVTNTSSPNFGKCFGLRLDVTSSACLDGGVYLASLDGAVDNSGTISIAVYGSPVDPAIYFRVGDQIRIGDVATGIISEIDSGTDTITLEAAISADDGSVVNLTLAYGNAPDIGAYEWSTHPWSVIPNPSYEFQYPIYGTAMIDSSHLAVGDWIGVFDVEGNCYGVGQYQYDEEEEGYYYQFSAYAESANGLGDGFTSGEKMCFRFYVAGIGDVYAVDNQLIARYYPVIPAGGIHYTGDPVRVDLAAADIQEIVLRPGWNFISFNVQPESTVLEEAFSSILTGDNDHLEYVSDHMNFWWAEVGGSLTTVDAYYSYKVKLKDDCIDGCTLTITGLRVELPYTFNLTEGWCYISYLLNASAYAIKDNLGYSDNGIFSGIENDVVWIKGDSGNWCSPDIGWLRLQPGKGLSIKMQLGSDVTFTYNDEGEE